MHPLSPHAFFDLSNFTCREIFNGCQYVWNALDKIKTHLCAKVLGEIKTVIADGVVLVDKEYISIGEGTVIEPGVYIKGPCIIGKNCRIRHGAYLRGEVICGDYCVIGHATEVKNSLLLDHAQAAHFAYVGDSILGNHTNLGAGTKCANLRFDNQLVSICLDGRAIETGRRKLGAIFGDFSQSGCNSVTNPGTLLGKMASIYPCASAHGFIPSGYSYRQDGSLVKKALPQQKGESHDRK